MKTKPTLSLLLILILLSTATKAQEKRYVETIVTDTVMLKPVQFKYEISSGDVANPYDIYTPKDENETSNATSINDVELALKKEKFSYTMKDENNFTIVKSGKDKPSIVVTLKSMEELAQLYKLLSVYKGISGKIISSDYESPSVYYNVMFKRLYDKAFSEATMLAKISGNEIDKMASATEIVEQGNSYMDWIFEMAKFSSSGDLFGGSGGLYKVYTRKFSFRFDLK
jgi:hypothetical protein